MDIPLGRLVGTVRHFASGITPHPGPHRAARLDHHRAKGACSLAPVVAPGGPRDACRRQPTWSLRKEAPEPPNRIRRDLGVLDLDPATWLRTFVALDGPRVPPPRPA